MTAQNDKQIDKRISSMLSSVNRDTNEPNEKFLEELRERSTAEFLAYSTGSEQQSEKTIPISKWRIIMKSRITKLTAAAVIIIASLIGIDQIGGSLDITGVAWGEVVKKVEQIDSFIFQQQISITSIDKGSSIQTTETITYVSSEFGLRQDAYMNGHVVGISYIPPTGTIITQVIPSEKKYRNVSTSDEHIRKTHEQVNPVGMIKEFMLFKHTGLGRKIIDGVEVEGIEVNDPGFLTILTSAFESAVGRLWVDVETNLPVRTEIVGISGNGSIETKIVAYDFDWEAEPEPSIFEPNIPDDYTLLEK